MATIEELQEQIAALSARVDALTVPPNRYYSSRYTGETIDKLLTSISGGAANLDLSNLTDYQRALHNIGGRPNHNFLRNALFIGGGDAGVLPVNQRGQKVYYNGSSIDRWTLVGNGEQKVEVQSDGILLTTTAQFGAYFVQVIDPGDLAQLRGKTVTLSSYLGDDTGFEGGMQAYIDGEYFIGISARSNDINFGTFIIPETASTMYVQFGASGTGTCKAKACKLEEGKIQTLGWKDSSGSVHLFETSNYGEDLARCQRYCYIPSTSYTGPQFRYYGGGEDRLIGILPFPVQMRTIPVLSGFPITFRDTDTGENVVVDSAQYFICDTGLTLWWQLNTTSGSFVDGHLYTVTSQIVFSAEL